MVDFDSINQNIIRNNYSLIGSGSGRNVYDLGNGYVVKKARNQRGIVQNEAEYLIFNDTRSELLARILAISDDNVYLVMEKAKKINSMMEVWSFYHVKSARDFFLTDLFRRTASRYELLPNDLYRKTSWGIVDGRPVVIDYGYTKATRRFYTRFRM